MSQPDRSSDLNRRDFVKVVGAAGLAASVPWIGSTSSLALAQQHQQQTGPSPSDPAETAVARLFKTLKKEQRELICFPFDHPLGSRVENNWAIVKPTIDDMTPEQQALCREIMKNLCSEDGYERFQHQMDEDYGGFESYHVAIFGEPGNGQPFQWVLTGRHNTLRADGNSVDGVAFGGPIFYGHASGSFNEDAQHTGNVWWYQAEQANKIFKSLDDKQQKQALVDGREPDHYRSVRLRGDDLPEKGLLVADLDRQQKPMVKKLLEDLLLPFRHVDAEEVRECLDEAGGLDKLRLTFFSEGDIGNDGVWDIWKLEGPAFSWYFHGEPHIHTWLNVARKATDAPEA